MTTAAAASAEHHMKLRLRTVIALSSSCRSKYKTPRELSAAATVCRRPASRLSEAGLALPDCCAEPGCARHKARQREENGVNARAHELICASMEFSLQAARCLSRLKPELRTTSARYGVQPSGCTMSEQAKELRTKRRNSRRRVFLLLEQLELLTRQFGLPGFMIQLAQKVVGVRR